MQNKNLFKIPTAVKLVPIILQLKLQIHQEGPIKRHSGLWKLKCQLSDYGGDRTVR